MGIGIEIACLFLWFMVVDRHGFSIEQSVGFGNKNRHEKTSYHHVASSVVAHNIRLGLRDSNGI